MFRVVHLSTTDIRGGAALAAHRLHHALPERGVSSRMFVAMKDSTDPQVVEFKPSIVGPRALDQFLFRGARLLQRRSLRTPNGIFMTHDWTFFGGLAQRQVPAAEIIHLHWSMDLLDFRMLAPLSRRAPLVWTFHDMNAFTGGCHYDASCGRFTAACGACPLLASDDPQDETHHVFLRKMDALRAVPDARLRIVCPSRWMAEETQRSALFQRFETEVIPNGIDLATFRPLDRAALRRQYALAPEDRVVFFVADWITDPRKGWLELEQALAKISHLPHLRILTLGAGNMERMQGPLFRHLGRLTDPQRICEAYNLADLFVIPTLQDNFPNTVLEALACGTPVVGFATGGVADAVVHESCGLLAPTGDIEGLAAHLQRGLLDDTLRAAMGQAARRRAVENYGIEQQARAMAALYQRLADEQSTPAAPRARTPASDRSLNV